MRQNDRMKKKELGKKSRHPFYFFGHWREIFSSCLKALKRSNHLLIQILSVLFGVLQTTSKEEEEEKQGAGVQAFWFT